MQGVIKDEAGNLQRSGQIMEGFESRTRTLDFVLRIMESHQEFEADEG